MADAGFNRGMTWDYFSAAITQSGGRCPAEFADIPAALRFLRGLLGEDYVEEANRIHAHPFLGLAVFSWPGARQQFLDWIGYVRSLQDCTNVKRVLDDLRVPTKSIHAYTLLDISGQLVQQGFRVSFEPGTNTHEFRFRPDALVELPATGESLYLEVSRQSRTHLQMSAFDAMAACERPVKEHFEALKCLFRLQRIPAPEHLNDLTDHIRAAVGTVLSTGHLVEIEEEGVLSMGICRRENAQELASWGAVHGIHFDGYAGPVDSVNEIDELKKKLRSKQRQLPFGYPNLLYIENDGIFSHYPVSAFHLDLQEEIFQHTNLAFVLLRGSNGSGRDEVPEAISYGAHKFERRVDEGQVQHTLLMLNRYARPAPSDRLTELVTHSLVSLLPSHRG